MFKRIVFMILIITTALFAAVFFPFSIFAEAGTSMAEYADIADAGFSLLEKILIITGASGGGVVLLLLRIARQGTKTLLKSLDSNPYVSNEKLVTHAIQQGDQKAKKLFEKINQPNIPSLSKERIPPPPAKPPKPEK